VNINNDQVSSWFVIVNPNAGRKKGKKDWPEIAALLKTAGIPFINVFTERRGHAVFLARDAIRRGYERILVVGGDGTMNEVVNGIFRQNTVPTSSVCLGMITVGTGNDWGRMFNIPVDYEEAIRLLNVNRSFLQDAGVVRYKNGNYTEKRYFVNIAGLGFDAVVARKTNQLKKKGRGGTLVYIWSLMTTLVNYRHCYVTLNIDGESLTDQIFSISVGIGKFNGGGMMQLPNAVADDGLFDITVIRKIGRLNVIRSVGRLFNGTITEHPKVKSFTGRKILVSSEPMILLEADGETLGHSPFSFGIIPKSIQVITGNMHQ
jgi:YegS/Rv2252/BmrU family lipid kinase